MAIKLNQLAAVLVRNYIAGVPTLIRGKPGIGKTQTIEAFAESMRKRTPEFQLWRMYAPTMSPMDIQASAPDSERGTLRMYNNEALPNAYAHPDVRGVIFFGELLNTDPATAKLLQKYVNGEDMSGTLRKPGGIVVIADSNRIEDKASVQQQGRAFMSRFEQLEVYTDAEDNAAYAAKNAWHPTVQLFFKDNPALIDNYDEVFETSDAARQRSAAAKQTSENNYPAEEGKLGVWANMRSWERISKKEYAADQLGTTMTLAEAAGNVGAGVAAQYEAHKKIISSLPAFEAVMANPEKAIVPKQLDEQYQMAVIVGLKCKEEQLQKVYAYCTRLPLELQAVTLRTLVLRKGFNLAATPVYQKWIVSEELNTMIVGR